MTIDNLEAIVSPSPEDLLLIRHSGKEWKYPLSTLASNLVNDPTISAATLGTASHPFETANITTLNVGGHGTVNGNLTVQATTDTAEASLLKVGKTLTVNGHASVSGDLYAKNLGTDSSRIDTIKASTLELGVNSTLSVSGSLTLKSLSAPNSTLFLSKGNIGQGNTSLSSGETITTLNVGTYLSLQNLEAPNSTLTIFKGDIGNATKTVLTSGGEIGELSVRTALDIGTLNAKNSTITASDGDITTTSITASALSSLTVTDSITSKALSMTGGTLTVGSSGEVTVGSSSNTNAEISSSGVLTLNCDSSFGSDDVSGGDSTLSKKCALHSKGSIYCVKTIWGSQVFNAVWNDLADCIPVNKEAVIEPGYCYCFDGEKYYKSTKYLEKGIIGIESDTYGMHMGSKPGVKQMDVAVSGFALAYVDKEYESGTPLTCTENGYLTEIAKQDKIEYPERIVGTYWKPEPNEEWGSSDRKVKVNGRHWIKIR